MNTLILNLSLVVVTAVHGSSKSKTESFHDENTKSLSNSTLWNTLGFRNVRSTERKEIMNNTQDYPMNITNPIHPRNTGQCINGTRTSAEIVDGSSRRKSQSFGSGNTKSNSNFTLDATAELRNVRSSTERKKMNNTQDCDVAMITTNPIQYSRNKKQRRINRTPRNMEIRSDPWKISDLLEYIKNPTKIIIDAANKLVRSDLLEFIKNPTKNITDSDEKQVELNLLEFIKNPKKNIIDSVQKLVNSDFLEFIKNPKEKTDSAQKVVKSFLLKEGITIGQKLGEYLKLASRMVIYIALFALQA